MAGLVQLLEEGTVGIYAYDLDFRVAFFEVLAMPQIVPVVPIPATK